MRRLEPGEWVAVGLIAEALLIDVVLIRRGHQPISTCVRQSPAARRTVRWLSAHLTDTVPHDLLSLAGRAVERRLHGAVPR